MLKKMVCKIREFHRNDSGDVLQYGILAAVFSVIAVGAYLFLGPKIKNLFDQTGNKLDEANGYSYKNSYKY